MLCHGFLPHPVNSRGRLYWNVWFIGGGPFRTKLGTGFCVFPGRGRARTVCKVILLEKADLHAADMERESPDPVEFLHNQDPKRTRRVYRAQASGVLESRSFRNL